LFSYNVTVFAFRKSSEERMESFLYLGDLLLVLVRA